MNGQITSCRGSVCPEARITIPQFVRSVRIATVPAIHGVSLSRFIYRHLRPLHLIFHRHRPMYNSVLLQTFCPLADILSSCRHSVLLQTFCPLADISCPLADISVLLQTFLTTRPLRKNAVMTKIHYFLPTRFTHHCGSRTNVLFSFNLNIVFIRKE